MTRPCYHHYIYLSYLSVSFVWAAGTSSLSVCWPLGLWCAPLSVCLSVCRLFHGRHSVWKSWFYGSEFPCDFHLVFGAHHHRLSSFRLILLMKSLRRLSHHNPDEAHLSQSPSVMSYRSKQQAYWTAVNNFLPLFCPEICLSGYMQIDHMYRLLVVLGKLFSNTLSTNSNDICVLWIISWL